MVFVGSGPIVEELDAKYWRVAAPVVYHGARQEFIVPEGFRTDFASVPRAVVWLVPRYGVYTKAAILHDFLRQSHTVSAADADGIFRRCLHEDNVSIPRRYMMWAAVRFGSGLRGASVGQIVLCFLIAVPSVLFLAVPATVVTVFGVLFWLVELCFWGIARLGRRAPEPPPTPEMKSA
ncbi:DUF1353 domain-containing protein [Nocardia sp. NPDC052566]|uniref:DUF1353 domain-containing protein n=1 Tax=Nocardia sp. NPDC052566 TaxID=3364330 RepID=UPI0037C74595